MGVINGDPDEISQELILKKKFSNMEYLLVACLVSAIYCVITSFGTAPVGVLEDASDIDGFGGDEGCKDGLKRCICPRNTVCAQSIVQVASLGIARVSIYAVYPFIMILFLSKANHLVSLLQSSVFGVYFQFSELHHLHTQGGKIVELATWVHVFFHCLRWGFRDELDFLIYEQTGMTGVVATIVMPFITWPMASDYLHKKLKFEYRKGLHYLSWIWGLALVFHAPAVNIAYLVGIPLFIYFLNYALGLYFGTFLVRSTIFRRLDTGVSLSFENPKGFELTGASYALVMLPWINTLEWHAFSVFPHPTEPNHSSFCISAVGDWSKKLHNEITRPTARPAWLCGPFLSPFATAHDFDNIITLATGIGITPALAVLNMFQETRRVNLIWMCRDPSLIEYFVSAVPFPASSFVLIYYTGKKKLLLNESVPGNVLLFKGRPVLDRVVTGIVERIETEQGLPEMIVEEGKSLSDLPPTKKFIAILLRVLETSDPSDFYDLCEEASQLLKNKHASPVHMKSFKNSGRISQVRMPTLNRSFRGSKRAESSGFVTKEGMAAGLNEYMGRFEFTPDDVGEVFEHYDKDKNGTIDRAEFTRMLISLDDDEESDSDLEYASDIEHQQVNRDTLRRRMSWTEVVNTCKSAQVTTKPQKITKTAKATFSPNAQDEFHEAKEYCLQHPLDMKTWQMLYCGGSAPVVSSLKKISSYYQIDLRIEKFDW